MSANPHDVKNDLKQFSEINLRKDQFENQRVIIRIWTSRFNIDRQGDNIGHVSIENQGNFYLSLWPTKVGKNVGSGFTSAIEHKFQRDLAADIKAEGNRQPEYTLCFYTLDVDKIKKKYDEVCQNTEGWSVTGLAICGGGDSCASSVWKLLIAGNLGKLISHLDQSSASAAGSSGGIFLSNLHGSSYASEMIISPTIKSPDAIAKLLQKAKLKELKKAPLTKELIFDGETPITNSPQSDWKNKCFNATLSFFNYLKKNPKVVAMSAGVIGLACAANSYRKYQNLS